MDLSQVYEKVIKADGIALKKLVSEALSNGVSPVELISTALTPALKEVGDRFEAGHLFIPEMMASANAVKLALEILKPLISDGDLSSRASFMIGTVEGDVHDIGKSIVSMMMEVAGFDVHDLGVNVKPEQFIEKASGINPNIVGMSALLTSTLPNIEKTVVALERSGLRKKVLIMIGGVPVTQEYADRIGADGYAVDAAGAVRKAKQLLGI